MDLQVDIDVLEKHIVSSSALKTQPVCLFEMLVSIYKSTNHYNSEKHL
jgi:hypothetical protein